MLSLCLPDLFLSKPLLTTIFIVRNSFLCVPGLTTPDVGDPFCQTNKMQKISLSACREVAAAKRRDCGTMGSPSFLLQITLK